MRFSPAAPRPRRSAAAALSLVLVAAACATLAGAADARKSAAGPTSKAAAFRWDGHSFRRAGALRRHVESRGVRWERFLAARPAVVRAFGLRPVPWGGRKFYANASVARWLRARGRSHARWRRIHPGAAARLRLNDRAVFRRAADRPAASTPTSPDGPGAPPEAAPAPAPGPAPAAPGGGAAGTPSAAPAAAAQLGVSPDNIEYAEPAARDRILDELVAVGAKWIRFDVKWAAIQWHGPDSWDWSRYDGLVEAARARGLSILGTLAYTPPWARVAGCEHGLQCAPRDADEFGRWAQVVAGRYRGKIDHWEVWNEPNWGFWRPKPDAQAYVALLRATYPRLKAAAPEATVLAGATAPAPNDGWAIDEVTFLQRAYAHGAKGFFDAWSHHPYSHPHAPSFAHPDASWHQMAAGSPSIRSVMQANGDGGKRVWATEYGSPTSGAPNAVSEQAQAQHLEQAFGLWRGYDWSGVLFWYGAADGSAYGRSGDSLQFHGLLRADFSRKPAWDVFRAAAGS